MQTVTSKENGGTETVDFQVPTMLCSRTKKLLKGHGILEYIVMKTLAKF